MGSSRADENARSEFAARFALLYELAGNPVLKRVADRANASIVSGASRRTVYVSAQRLSDWRGGRNVPARFEGLSAALHVLVAARSEEHTSELQSLKRISYAVFSLKK